MHDRLRCVLRTIVFLMLLVSPRASWSQLTTVSQLAMPLNGSQSGQYVMTGTLELRPQGYALVSGSGQLETYLIPRKSLDLTGLVGQMVEATVREPMVRTGTEPRLWLDSVSLHQQAGSSGAAQSLFDPASPGQIALTQYAEPIATSQVSALAAPVADRLVPESWGPRGWIWASAEFLHWWPQGMYIPPLVTTSPLGTAREVAGVLGETGTQILYGQEDLFTTSRNGLRFRGGVWLDSNNRYAVQGEYFAFETGNASFAAASDATGNPILARPFFNVNPRDPFTEVFDPPARNDAQLISYPNVLQGSITVTASSRLQSAGLAFRELLALDTFCGEHGTGFSRVDVLLGYRHMRLEEDINIVNSLASVSSQIPASLLITDLFDTRNQFHGVDVGMGWQAGWGKWSVDLLVKTALGNVQQEALVQGGTVISLPGTTPLAYDGGFLALPSNMGSYSQDRFGVIPELGVTFGFTVLPRIRLTAGYSFIYWGTVLRPGHLIDLDINPDQLPPPIIPMAGAARPEFAFHETEYWVHGVNVGLEGRW